MLEKTTLIKLLASFYLLLIPDLKINAQKSNIEFSRNLTISDGLAHNGITSILEDSKGYLWFGTYEGISYYDGYEFKTIKNTVDSKPLISNRVRSIVEDTKQNIWIGTDEGISIYNTAKENYFDLYSNKLIKEDISGPVIRNIMPTNTGYVLCASEGYGVLMFKDNYTYVDRYIPSGKISNKRITFFNGYQLDNNNYLYTTSSGLLHFNLRTKLFEQVFSDNIVSCNSISKISKNTFVTTLSYGLIVFGIEKNNESYNFKIINKDLKGYAFNGSMTDSTGKLWLSLLNDGMMVFDDALSLKNKNYNQPSFFEFKTGQIKASIIYSTSAGSCWLGTFNEGLYQFDLNKNPFKKYNTKMNFPFGLKTNNVTSISVIDNNRIYASSNTGGISLFNSKTNSFEKLPFNFSKEEKVKLGSVFLDSRKNVWTKITGIGLCRIKPGHKRYETVNTKNSPIDGYIHIHSYTEDKQGNIWFVGANGAYKITINEENEIVNIESINDNLFFEKKPLGFVRRIYTDPILDYIWIGTDKDGLFRLDSKESLSSAKINQYLHDDNNKKSISNDFVSSIIRLPNRELWIGTEGGGVCKVINSESNPEFITYSEKQGLSNNVVKSILYDDDYNLWIATNIGLNKLNTKNFSIRRFNNSDGLPFEDFWYTSVSLKNGYMIFSGLDGFCYFKPEQILNKENLPRFEFGNLKLFNKPILANDTINGRVLLNKRLEDTEAIELKHNENVFSLELTSLHFTNPANHHIKYKLSPLNEDWIEVPSSKKTIYYSGLQPGEYQLQAMASNSLNEWTKSKTLNILVNPPIWKTTMAYVTYLGLAFLFIYIISRVILKIQALNHKVEIEQLEKDNAKELNAAKLRFFSNISHEIKTPLSLISGPINLLLNEFNKNFGAVEKLKLVQRQSKKMLQLVDQVHDFQKADVELLTMNYSHFYFMPFIKNLTNDFQFMAKMEQKTLNLKHLDEEILVSADKDKLEKILNNLLNNAFKYTKERDSITLDITQNEKDLTILVIDTGRGIDSEDVKHVFERFYQSHKKHNEYIGGSGIGLAFSKRLVEMHYGYIEAESELNKGTKIKIQLPIIKQLKNENETFKEDLILTAEKEHETNTLLIENDNISNIKFDSAFSNATIFYVEDHLDMRTFVSTSLSKFFIVKTFSNGQECIDAMEEEWPDILISDLLMPELNGLDLCKRIKSDVKTSHIPIILLTACTTTEDKIQGLRDGADAYIKKPFNMEHLITRTEALLLNRKQLRERYQVGIPLTKENNKNNANDNAFLEKLYALMAENLDNQDLDLNQFAKELYLNRTHFYQKVKALTNHTPFELLKIYRLTKGAEFLAQHEMSVKEASLRTGFKSRTHFTKLFKEKYNVTPGMYASEMKKKHS